jgi:hypothetical protein
MRPFNLQLHFGYGIDSVSKLKWVSGVCLDYSTANRLTASPTSPPDVASTSHSPLDLHGLLGGSLTFYSADVLGAEVEFSR